MSHNEKKEIRIGGHNIMSINKTNIFIYQKGRHSGRDMVEAKIKIGNIWFSHDISKTTFQKIRDAWGFACKVMW
jgi:hypothetical protein